MNTCTHIIGLASGGDYEDCWTSNVEAGEIPDGTWQEFKPYKFCPHCGKDVAALAAAYQALLDAAVAAWREKWAAMDKTGVDKMLTEESSMLAKKIGDIARQPGRLSTLFEKPPLPEGMGYNFEK